MVLRRFTTLSVLIALGTHMAGAARYAHHTAHTRPSRPHKPKPDIHAHPGRSDPKRGHPVHWAKPPPEAREGKWVGRVVYEWGYYDGEWLDGRWHGHGECHHDDDGRTYIGQHENHHQHGKGKMIWPDGHIATGNWYRVHSWMVNQGDGEIHWLDGRTYKGHWVNAQPHGIGTLTYPDGHTVGPTKWKHGHCVECDVLHAALHKKEYLDHDEHHHLHRHVQHVIEEHGHLDLEHPSLQGKLREGWKEYAHLAEEEGSHEDILDEL